MNFQEAQKVFADLQAAYPDIFQDEREAFIRIMGKVFVRALVKDLDYKPAGVDSFPLQLSEEEAEKWRERSQRLSDKVARFDPNWDGRRILYPETAPVQTNCHGHPINGGNHITAGSPEWAV